jgi:hypothetical protein
MIPEAVEGVAVDVVPVDFGVGVVVPVRATVYIDAVVVVGNSIVCNSCRITGVYVYAVISLSVGSSLVMTSDVVVVDDGIICGSIHPDARTVVAGDGIVSYDGEIYSIKETDTRASIVGDEVVFDGSVVTVMLDAHTVYKAAVVDDGIAPDGVVISIVANVEGTADVDSEIVVLNEAVVSVLKYYPSVVVTGLMAVVRDGVIAADGDMVAIPT